MTRKVEDIEGLERMLQNRLMRPYRIEGEGEKREWRIYDGDAKASQLMNTAGLYAFTNGMMWTADLTPSTDSVVMENEGGSYTLYTAISATEWRSVTASADGTRVHKSAYFTQYVLGKQVHFADIPRAAQVALANALYGQ